MKLSLKYSQTHLLLKKKVIFKPWDLLLLYNSYAFLADYDRSGCLNNLKFGEPYNLISMNEFSCIYDPHRKNSLLISYLALESDAAIVLVTWEFRHG
jgi:hypothetical protein